MANTTTGRYAFTKPEIGAATDSWGTLLNTNWDDADSQILRKLDKSMVKSNSQTITITGSSKRITTTTTKGFQNIEVGDKIFISGSDPAGQTNDGIHTVTAIDTTNWLYVDCSGSTLYDDGPQTITWGLVTQIARTEISTVDIDSGTIDGTDVNMTSGTLTTTTAQKDAIVDGSTAITRSSNDLTFAGNVDVTGDLTVTGNDIKSSGGTTVATFSGANTTLAGTANNIGTVTAGTINDTVNIIGVPTNTQIVQYSDANNVRGAASATEQVFSDSISYACKSGKTYVFSATGTGLIFRVPLTSDDIGGYINLKHHTSSVSQGATNPSGTIMNAGRYESGDNASVQTPFHIIGIFECTSDETKHFYVSVVCDNNSTYLYLGEGSANRNTIITLQEYDSDNVTVT